MSKHGSVPLRLDMLKFAGGTKINENCPEISRNHNVIGLDVTVQYIPVVYILNSVGNLHHIIHRIRIG